MIKSRSKLVGARDQGESACLISLLAISDEITVPEKESQDETTQVVSAHKRLGKQPWDSRGLSSV